MGKGRGKGGGGKSLKSRPFLSNAREGEGDKIESRRR